MLLFLLISVSLLFSTLLLCGIVSSILFANVEAYDNDWFNELLDYYECYIEVGAVVYDDEKELAGVHYEVFINY